ncbi:actinoporin [Paramuricea clavata]|uniref:Actinoporin, partial n=1 Tax=Paramuricea clavata TaxID=317549 RepID=A0A7D9DPM9_PARCT|nr:actinoporin [Paramuricea clavata]
MKVLDTLGNTERKIAIGIGNDTPFAWKADGVYFRSGTSDDVLPACLSSKEAAVFPARKTSGLVATGADVKEFSGKKSHNHHVVTYTKVTTGELDVNNSSCDE